MALHTAFRVAGWAIAVVSLALGPEAVAQSCAQLQREHESIVAQLRSRATMNWNELAARGQALEGRMRNCRDNPSVGSQPARTVAKASARIGDWLENNPVNIWGDKNVSGSIASNPVPDPPKGFFDRYQAAREKFNSSAASAPNPTVTPATPFGQSTPIQQTQPAKQQQQTQPVRPSGQTTTCSPGSKLQPNGSCALDPDANRPAAAAATQTTTQQSAPGSFATCMAGNTFASANAPSCETGSWVYYRNGTAMRK